LILDSASAQTATGRKAVRIHGRAARQKGIQGRILGGARAELRQLRFARAYAAFQLGPVLVEVSQDPHALIHPVSK
jgi:hypothetical protein